ncbi:hypothetical protein K8T06_13105 [bacterium]|nr:hypothetical protein [bacterium]
MDNRKTKHWKWLILIMTAVLWIGCESDTTITGLETSTNSKSSRSKHQGMGGNFAEGLITIESGGVMIFKNGNLQVQPHSIDETKIVWVVTYNMTRGNFFKKIYEFGPSGTIFNPPAILTLNYCDLGPLMPDTIDLLVFNETNNQWEVASHMVNDPSSKTFTGPIDHFSRYSLSGNGQVLKPKLN